MYFVAHVNYILLKRHSFYSNYHCELTLRVLVKSNTSLISICHGVYKKQAHGLTLRRCSPIRVYQLHGTAVPATLQRQQDDVSTLTADELKTMAINDGSAVSI